MVDFVIFPLACFVSLKRLRSCKVFLFPFHHHLLSVQIPFRGSALLYLLPLLLPFRRFSVPYLLSQISLFLSINTFRLFRSPFGALLYCIYSLFYYRFEDFQPPTSTVELLRSPLFTMEAPSSSKTKKRQRQDSSASEHDTNADVPFPPLNLTPFNCTRKLKDMDPTDLTDYFPQLPEKTQYFDMGRILDNKLQGNPYYTEDLLIWREASMPIV